MSLIPSFVTSDSHTFKKNFLKVCESDGVSKAKIKRWTLLFYEGIPKENYKLQVQSCPHATVSLLCFFPLQTGSQGPWTTFELHEPQLQRSEQFLSTDFLWTRKSVCWQVELVGNSNGLLRDKVKFLTKMQRSIKNVCWNVLRLGTAI